MDDLRMQLSEFSYRLECGIAMVDAVRELLHHGDFSPECYEPALFGAYMYLLSLGKELDAMIEGDAA